MNPTVMKYLESALSTFAHEVAFDPDSTTEDIEQAEQIVQHVNATYGIKPEGVQWV